MKERDIESGNELYPGMMESPEIRWAFIRKVYSIICAQLLLTVAISAVVVYCDPVSHFIKYTTAGLIVYIVVVVFSFVSLMLLSCVQNRHPWNMILLALFTMCLSLMVGVSCAFSKGDSYHYHIHSTLIFLNGLID